VEIILLLGGSGSLGLQTSRKPVSSSVQNAGSHGENMTESQISFYATFKSIFQKIMHIIRKVNSQI
jgi:hypothetical protein